MNHDPVGVDGGCEVDINAALDRLRALDPDRVALAEYWARHADLPAEQVAGPEGRAHPLPSATSRTAVAPASVPGQTIRVYLATR